MICCLEVLPVSQCSHSSAGMCHPLGKGVEREMGSEGVIGNWSSYFVASDFGYFFFTLAYEKEGELTFRGPARAGCLLTRLRRYTLLEFGTVFQQNVFSFLSYFMYGLFLHIFNI